MAYPKDQGTFILDTDASDGAIGAVLSLEQDGKERVIFYGSRTLNKAESNYCVTDKELLAIRYFVEHYRQYLLGRQFRIRTDHQALIWLFKLREPKGRVARWIQILSQFDFAVEYRPGAKHQNADAMSLIFYPRDCRCCQNDMLEILKCGPCSKCKRKSEIMDGPSMEAIKENATNSTERKQDDDDIKIGRVSTRSKKALQPITSFGTLGIQELMQLQNEDETLKEVIKWVEQKERPEYKKVATESPELRHYWHLWPSLKMKEGILYNFFLTKDGISEYIQFMVPHSMRSKVLRITHNSRLGGHLGQKKTKKKIKQRFFWFEMKEYVNIWVSKCDVSCRMKQLSRKPRAALGDMRVGAPLDRVSIDLVGPLPETKRGNQHILALTDHFSKWAEAYPIPNQTAITCATVLCEECITRFGCPLSIHTDQGRCFEADLFSSSV
jgi:hypothetical protein